MLLIAMGAVPGGALPAILACGFLAWKRAAMKWWQLGILGVLQAAMLARGGFDGLPAMETACGAYIGLTGGAGGEGPDYVGPCECHCS